MARYVLLAAALVGCVLADDASYAAPANNYAAPATGYGAPANSYSAPTGSYSASSYEEPSYNSYAEPASGYGVAEEEPFKLDKLVELIPFFLAVLAAIIIAQLIAPLISVLIGAKVGLVSTGLAPLVPAKLGLINAVLAPFSLALCSTAGGTLTVAGARAMDVAREFAEENNLNPELLEGIAKFATTLYDSYMTGQTE